MGLVGAPEPAAEGGWACFMESVSEIARFHRRDVDGFCEQWRRLVPYPCTQAEWARFVIDRYGGPWPGQSPVESQ